MTNKVEISYGNKNITRFYPGKWGEMERSHLLSYCKAVENGLTEEGLLTAILYHWLGLAPNLFFSIWRGYLTDMYHTLFFLFMDKIQFTKLLIAKVRLPLSTCIFKTYYGPGENFKNLRVGEFSYADSYCEKYLAECNADDLSMAVACLYRPTSIAGIFRNLFYDGDIRVKFNNRVATRRAKRFRRLPAYMKRAMLYNFIGFRNVVVENNPNLFTKKNDDTTQLSFGWAGVMHSMAGPELGTMEDVQNMLFSNAIVVLSKISEDRKVVKKSEP